MISCSRQRRKEFSDFSFFYFCKILFYPVQQFLWNFAELSICWLGSRLTAKGSQGSYKADGHKSRRPHRVEFEVHSVAIPTPKWGTLELWQYRPPESGRREARKSLGYEGHGEIESNPEAGMGKERELWVWRASCKLGQRAQRHQPKR